LVIQRPEPELGEIRNNGRKFFEFLRETVLNGKKYDVVHEHHKTLVLKLADESEEEAVFRKLNGTYY